MLTPPEWARNANYAALVYFKSGPRAGGAVFYGRALSRGQQVANPEQLELRRLGRMIAGWKDKIETAEIYDMRDGQRLLHKFSDGRWVQ